MEAKTMPKSVENQQIRDFILANKPPGGFAAIAAEVKKRGIDIGYQSVRLIILGQTKDDKHGVLAIAHQMSLDSKNERKKLLEKQYST